MPDQINVLEVYSVERVSTPPAGEPKKILVTGVTLDDDHVAITFEDDAARFLQSRLGHLLAEE